MKRFFRLLGAGGKWILLSLIGIEIFSFLLISFTNLVLFGTLWEGSQAYYDAYALFLNAEGVQPTLHNPPESESDTAGKQPRRLWLFGGSTMRGGWVQPGETIASYLAEMVNRPENLEKMVVTNYGENSFNSLLETKYLQKLLIDTDRPPDLVIFYDGANDCAYFNQYRTPQAHYAYRRVQGLIESYRKSYFSLLKPLNAALYSSFSLEVFDKFRQIAVPVHTANPAPRKFVLEAEKRYDHVRRLAGAYGADFLLVWQPFLWVETGEVDPAIKAQDQSLAIFGRKYCLARRNFKTTNDALVARLKDKPYFVDFRNILCQRTTQVYEADGVHLKPEGNRMVAAKLAELLKAKGWLGKQAVSNHPDNKL